MINLILDYCSQTNSTSERLFWKHLMAFSSHRTINVSMKNELIGNRLACPVSTSVLSETFSGLRAHWADHFSIRTWLSQTHRFRDTSTMILGVFIACSLNPVEYFSEDPKLDNGNSWMANQLRNIIFMKLHYWSCSPAHDNGGREGTLDH